MQKNIGIYVIAFLFLGAAFFIVIKKELLISRLEKNNPPVLLETHYLEIAHYLQKIWHQGDLDLIKDSSCYLKKYQHREDFELCNSDYLECLFTANPHGKTPQGVEFEVLKTMPHPLKQELRYTMPLSYANSNYPGGLLLDVREKKSRYPFRIHLQENCHQISLPRGFYTYWHSENPHREWSWENIARKVSIDKFLVTRKDFRDWWYFSSHEQRDIFKKKFDWKEYWEEKNLSLPMTKIPLGMMKTFCRHQGKTLMLAHYLEAVAFKKQFVEDEKFQKQLLKTHSLQMQEQTCLVHFSSECREREERYYLFHTYPSWAGLKQYRGGLLEAVHNPIEPQKNLITSSFYFPKNHQFNLYGQKTYWNGRSMKSQDIDGWEDIFTEETELAIGFRCMKISYGP